MAKLDLKSRIKKHEGFLAKVYLDSLGKATIGYGHLLTEDSKNARLCNARYESIRNAVFRSHAWNCLMARQELAADTATPAWGWANQFTLPSDCHPHWVQMDGLAYQDLT